MRAESALRLCAALFGLWLVSATPSTASAQVFAEELRIKGIWPDLALQFGAGFGIGQRLATPVLGRARLGALFAYEPLILNVGVSGELGALARHGLGLELELNHFGGLWLQGGFERVRGDDWMTHATIGYTVVGIEWQHRFNDRPDNAVLFVVRATLGILWFLLEDDARRTREQHERQKNAPPGVTPASALPPPPTPAPSAAPPNAPATSAPPPGMPATSTPAPSASTPSAPMPPDAAVPNAPASSTPAPDIPTSASEPHHD